MMLEVLPIVLDVWATVELLMRSGVAARDLSVSTVEGVACVSVWNANGEGYSPRLLRIARWQLGVSEGEFWPAWWAWASVMNRPGLISRCIRWAMVRASRAWALRSALADVVRASGLTATKPLRAC
jgi:hypothetical protein